MNRVEQRRLAREDMVEIEWIQQMGLYQTWYDSVIDAYLLDRIIYFVPRILVWESAMRMGVRHSMILYIDTYKK